MSAKNQNRFLRFGNDFFLRVQRPHTSGIRLFMNDTRTLNDGRRREGGGCIAHNINECVDTILYSFIIIWQAHWQRLVHGKSRTPKRNRYDRIKWMLFMRCSTYVYPLTAHAHNINRRVATSFYFYPNRDSFRGFCAVDGTMSSVSY